MVLFHETKWEFMIALRENRHQILGIFSGALVFGIHHFLKAYELEMLEENRLATNIFNRTLYPQLSETCRSLLLKRGSVSWKIVKAMQCLIAEKKGPIGVPQEALQGIVWDLEDFSHGSVAAQLLKIRYAAYISLSTIGVYLSWRFLYNRGLR